MRRGGSITTRLITVLTLCAGVIIGLGMLLDYRLSRDELLGRLQRESDDTVRAAIIDMENWLNGIESATLLLARVLQQREYSQEGLRQMLRDVVEVNGAIFGATIALAQPPGAQDKSLGFAPYYYRHNGELAYADLAVAENNYQQQKWYTDTVAAGKPLWVEPYFDETGGRVLMTTFAVPVYRTDATGTRFLYAVLTADVALTELHHYLQRLRLGGNGFGVLLSRNGIVLSSRNPANTMRHFSDAIIEDTNKETLQEMFEAVLDGEVITRQHQCAHVLGRCVMRLGSLQATGWPVGVVYSEDEMTAPLRAFELKIALTSLLTLLLIAISVVIVTRRLTRPLAALAQASDRIAQGDLDAPLPQAQGDDEVARLIQSFGAMKTDLKSYISDLEAATARRSRLQGELGAAREIQMAMLPHGGMANEQDETYGLWARVAPARSVGGDLYSYYRRDRFLFIAVGDVSDKGIPAAMFMARAISLIQQLAVTAADPAAAMNRLNDVLTSGNDNCMFVTLFMGLLNLDSLELRFSSAGHTAPSLARGHGVTSLAQESGPALGLAPDQVFPVNSVQLRAGDRLAMFTDGIDEAFNLQDEMFGIDRFNQALLASRALPITEAGDSLFDILGAFAGERPQSDDICLLLLDICPGAEADLHASERFALGPRLTKRVESWLLEELAQRQLPHKLLGDLKLLTEEIVSNVDKYAGLPAGASIEISLQATAERIEIEVRDAGIAFDPLTGARRAELGATIEEADVGGLGLHLITALSDRQSYRREDGCNILRITKLLQRAPG